MSKYPHWKYHRTKEPFICQSEDFFNTLKDKDEYEEMPFTGPRAALINAPKPHVVEPCKKCLLLGADNIDLKLEVERLRIALKMSENKQTPAPVKKKAGRPAKKV